MAVEVGKSNIRVLLIKSGEEQTERVEAYLTKSDLNLSLFYAARDGTYQSEEQAPDLVLLSFYELNKNIKDLIKKYVDLQIGVILLNYGSDNQVPIKKLFNLGIEDLVDPENFSQIETSIYKSIQNRNEKKRLQLDIHAMQSVIDQLPIATYTTNNDGLITYFNPAAEKIWGRKPELYHDKWCGSLKLFNENGIAIDKEDGPMCTIIQQQIPTHNVQAKLQQPSGDIIDFKAFASPIKNEQQEFVGAVNTLVDVTEHKKLQEELAHKTALFEGAMNASLDAIYLLEAKLNNDQVVDFIIRELNEKACQELSLNRDELIGNGICELFPINISNGLFDQYKTVYLTNKTIEQEYQIPQGHSAPGWFYQQIVATPSGIAIYNKNITKLKTLQTQQNKSNNSYKLLFGKAPLAKLIFNKKTLAITKVNEQMKFLYGYSELEFQQMTILDLVRKQNEEKLRDQLEKNFNTSGATLSYSKHYKKNGESIDVEIHGIDFEFENIDERQITIIDHSEKKKLEHSKNQILSSIADGFFAVDKNWTVTYWNKAAERLMNISGKDILGKNLWEVFPESKTQSFYKHCHVALNQKIPVEFIEQSLLTFKWFELSIFPAEGGITVYFKDVTSDYQQKRLIEKMRYNLNTMINSTHDLIWSVDTHMRLTVANNAALLAHNRITGKQIKVGDYIIPKNVSRKRKAKWKNYLERAISGEYINITEKGIDKISLKPVFTSLSVNPILDSEKKVIGAACFASDITQNINYQTAIEQQNERLKKIAWVQAHKVRAPLARIMGLIHLLEGDASCDPTLLKHINQSLQELDELVHQIVRQAESIEN